MIHRGAPELLQEGSVETHDMFLFYILRCIEDVAVFKERRHAFRCKVASRTNRELVLATV